LDCKAAAVGESVHRKSLDGKAEVRATSLVARVRVSSLGGGGWQYRVAQARWKRRADPADQGLGVIGNGHLIKLGRINGETAWDHSFERVFDRADDAFSDLIWWLEGVERSPVRDVHQQRRRFIPQPCTDAELARVTECAVSPAVCGPMNREASVALAEHLREPLPTPERNALIGLNIRNSHPLLADSIKSRGKFAAVYSQGREFVFGDGFFNNVKNVQNVPLSPKLFVPITPYICLLVCQPSRYTVEPRLTTLVLDDHEVDTCNKTVQVYAKNAIFFCSRQPALSEEFQRGKRLESTHPENPIDSLIHSIPGVPARETSLDHIFHPDDRRERICRTALIRASLLLHVAVIRTNRLTQGQRLLAAK
jgi:hypothetical protein